MRGERRASGAGQRACWPGQAVAARGAMEMAGKTGRAKMGGVARGVLLEGSGRKVGCACDVHACPTGRPRTMGRQLV